ncbi:MAG: GNAT family protein [Balneolales bacterium]
MVKLRDFNIKNAKTHFKWNNDEELNYFDSDFPLIPESFESFISRLSLITAKENKINQLLEIHEANLGILIGVVDIHNIDLHNHHCSIECSIADLEYRHQGYGTAALKKALRYCFEELDMKKVNAASFDFNKKWIKILNKLYFRQEGILRKHAIKNGVYADKLLFGLLKEEYMQNRSQKVAVGAE